MITLRNLAQPMLRHLNSWHRAQDTGRSGNRNEDSQGVHYELLQTSIELTRPPLLAASPFSGHRVSRLTLSSARCFQASAISISCTFCA